MKSMQFDLKRQLPKIIFCLIIGVICALLAQKRFYALILCFIGIYTIAVSGLDILYGYSGQISFGQAGFYAIGAYTSTLLSKNLGINPFFGTIIGAVFAVLVSMIVAVPASQLKRHFLSVFTTVFGLLINGLVGKLKFTGAATGIMKIPKYSILGYELKSRQANLVLIVIVMLILLFLKNRIVNSRVGRALVAIRENPAAAQGLGINVRSYKVMAFGISAAYASIAGSLYAHMVGFISPETFSGVTSTLFMTMLIFGGRTILAGPLLGAAIILPIREVFQSFVIYQGVVFALFMIAALFFFPQGLMGLFKETVDKIKAKKAGACMSEGEETAAELQNAE